jgi:hypothetical protein
VSAKAAGDHPQAPKPRVRPVSAASDGSEERADPKLQSEPERLVQSLTTSDQRQVSLLVRCYGCEADDQALDQLYAYMKDHPDKEGEVYTVISNLPSAVQAYIRRMLDSRKTADNPCTSPFILNMVLD